MLDKWNKGGAAPDAEGGGTPEALEERNSILELLTENAQAGMFLQQDGRFVYMNEQTCQFSGYPREELQGADITKFVHPEDRDMVVRRAVERAEGRGVPSTYEFRVLKKDGTVVWVELRAKLVQYEGRPAVAGSLLDVTERKINEKRLREERENRDSLYKDLVQTAPAAIGEVDMATGKFLRVNESACEYTGYTMEELLSMGPADLLAPESLERFHGVFEAMREGKPYALGGEYRIFAKDGRSIWVVINSRVVLEDGKPTRFRSVIMDITKRKEAEETAARSRDLQSLLTAISADFISLPVDKIEDGIQSGLAAISKFAGAQRACIYLLSEDTSHVLPAHQWAMEGVTKPHPDLGTLSPRTYIWLMERMRQSKSVRIRDAEQLDDDYKEERELCGKVKARALMMIPLGQFNGPTGLLTFDTLDQPRQWGGEIVKLVETAAQVFVNAMERKRTEAQLQQQDMELEVKSRQLEEVNRALRTLLNQSKEEARNVEQRLVANVEDLVLPYVRRLRETELDVDQQVYMKVIEENLEELMSPFMRRIGNKHANLTPREVEVANLVRMGTTSKEIAKLLNISKRAVEFHRDSLRKKLGLKNRKRNLRAYLSSLN